MGKGDSKYPADHVSLWHLPVDCRLPPSTWGQAAAMTMDVMTNATKLLRFVKRLCSCRVATDTRRLQSQRRSQRLTFCCTCAVFRAGSKLMTLCQVTLRLPWQLTSFCPADFCWAKPCQSPFATKVFKHLATMWMINFKSCLMCRR